MARTMAVEQTAVDRTAMARLAAGLLVAVSGGIHVRLYRGGYQAIHLDRILGIDLAASFVVAIIAATAISILLIAAVVRRGLEVPTTIVALAYCVGAVASYALTRTSGFLGFEESAWTSEAIAAKTVETIAIALLLFSLVGRTRR